MNKFNRNPFLKLFRFLQIKITKANRSQDNALVFDASEISSERIFVGL